MLTKIECKCPSHGIYNIDLRIDITTVKTKITIPCPKCKTHFEITKSTKIEEAK